MTTRDEIDDAAAPPTELQRPTERVVVFARSRFRLVFDGREIDLNSARIVIPPPLARK